MPLTDDSMQLLARWKQGDEQAAEEIFSRYQNRLALLAGNRLSARMRRRVDPYDVVQSAFHSFFRHAKTDRFELKRSGDLWRLLSAITINKVKQKVEFHHAARRSIDSEESRYEFVEDSAMVDYVREPTVDEATSLVDELESLQLELEPLDRCVLALRLQDQSCDEIADTIQRSTRTVRRILERIKTLLRDRLKQVNGN